MGINKISIHEEMPDASLQDQSAQKWLKLLHWLSESNALMGREAKFMKGETHLGDRHTPLFQVVSKTRKEYPEWTHQEENRAKNGNAFHPQALP
ncbi:MAG: hypothetical protein VKO26_01870 [Cyanobacteriota bacterium]|nr:hypothetical protein [Cyanobacteriota bacterium]